MNSTSSTHQDERIYRAFYKVKYQVEFTPQNTFEVIKLDEENTAKGKNDKDSLLSDDMIKLLKEAARTVYRRYGNVLFFTEPTEAVSHVYRTERERLWIQEQGSREVQGAKSRQSDSRFALSVHFFQAAVANGKYEPERYGGLLFLRPWSVHLEEFEETSKVDAGNHKRVTTAVCEGYLRPPLSFELSPNYSQAMGYYAAPYKAKPFHCMPFYASHFGACCAETATGAALLVAGLPATYSPYELAVLHVDARYKEDKRNPKFPISGTSPFHVQKVINEHCQGSGILETFLPNCDSDHTTTKRSFQAFLSAFLYQGIPVLCTVDKAAFYSNKKEKGGSSQKTKEGDSHMILLHGLSRQQSPDSPPKYYLYSDSTDLHDTGDIFGRVTLDRLWDSRCRHPVDDARTEEVLEAINFPADTIAGNKKLQAVNDSLVKTISAAAAAAIAIAVAPAYFKLGWREIAQAGFDFKLYALFISEIPLDQFERLESHLGEMRDSKGTDWTAGMPHLRDRSQLRGFLLNRLQGGGSDDHDEVSTLRTDLREKLRTIEIPRYLWIKEFTNSQTAVTVGFLIDVRYPLNLSERGEAEFQGMYVLPNPGAIGSALPAISSFVWFTGITPSKDRAHFFLAMSENKVQQITPKAQSKSTAQLQGLSSTEATQP